MTETLVFRTSEEALAQRRRLLRACKVMAGMALLLGLAAVAPTSLPLWALAAVLGFLLYRLDLSRWLQTYASREIRIQAQALEESRLGFTRFILFEQLEQLRVTQGKNEKILALELRTMQGAFVLRGYENMESLFGALSQRRPPRVMIEVEEAGIDWNAPTPWVIFVLSLGALALLAVFAFRK